jgi:hypothetical protein
MRIIKSTKPASLGRWAAVKTFTPPLALAFTFALAILAFGVASAQADSPWWHLSAGARPSYLRVTGQAKPGQSEVQEIATTPGTVAGRPEQTNFVLFVRSVGRIEEFATEPLAKEFTGVGLLTAENIQKALEGSNVYGAGNVTVKEEPTAGETEPKRFVITSVGADADTAVAPVEVGAEPGSGATASVLTPGKPPVSDGELYVTAENLGDANASGAKEGVQFKDVLPKGLKVVGVSGNKPHGGIVNTHDPIPCSFEEVGEVTTATCTTGEELAPYDLLEMRIGVNVEVSPSSELKQVASISGGGAQPVSVTRPVTISDQPVPFGVEHYEMALEEAGGVSSVQAGTHPFQMTTTIDFNQLSDIHPLSIGPEVSEPAQEKDVNVKLPPGLIGNPTPIPRCTLQQFYEVNTATLDGIDACPSDTAVGVADVTVHEPSTLETVTFPVPVFNLVPSVGEPARFAFYIVVGGTPVLLDTSIRSGGDYGVTVHVNNITQTAATIASTVTIWGTPSDPRHDNQRGWGCLFKARGLSPVPCTPAGQEHPAPFLVLPTSCKAPLTSSVETDSWDQPGVFQSVTEALQPESALSGCNRLQFAPEVQVKPDGQEASKPTGLTVDVHVPQEVNENAEGFASSNVKDITVAFPEGVVVNPASADGLQACGEGEVGLQLGEGAQGEFLFTPVLGEPFCPDASKIGTVTIKSPLLPKGENVEGSLYLANPAPNGELGKNPFNTLVASYIVATDPVSGTIVKLPGSVSLDPNTGRLTATFENQPQLAFEDAEIHLFGGERAPLATPSHCGTYTTDATFTPWSGTGAVKSSSSFEIKAGPGGGSCPPAALPFAPSLAAGSPNNNAGAFSPLTTTISREDGQQNVNKVRLHFAPGMSGILAGVPLCPEAQANAGTCSSASQIGKTIVSVGLGGDPYSVTGGQVFLTEKIAGSPADAPFGLSIVNPAKAGPFDLGKVVVRATIEVDPHTAALTVTTGEIPHILDGIPLQIKHVNVTIEGVGGNDRFTFNPTNCNPQSITGTIGSVEGASSPVSVPFQVTNCASLKFTPKFSISTSGKTSKAQGASLTAKLSEPNELQGSQANIALVKVELPKQLPSRLTTLQKACTNKQFELNPANCPPESKIGFAKVTTPLLPVPLEGPAIFVSHGGEAFPSLTMVLQGYGVSVDLVGTTFISKAGITSTTFKTVPDVPFNTFTLTLPQGKFSALAANGNLCASKLTMPTEFLAQNGAKINQSTPVSVTGCAKKKTLTRAQKLAAALKLCKKKAKSKRAACNAAARKRYGPVKAKKKTKGKRGA